MSVRKWFSGWRDRRTDELADELRAHLEMAVADRMRRGESPADALANARRELGNAGLAQEIARDQWGAAGMWLERLQQDVRHALRGLRRAPAFATITVATMALGIGATTAIFSVVDATLLRPLPYPHSEQLVRVEDDLVGLGSHDVGMSTPEWRDLERSGVFEHISPLWFDDNNLTGVSRPQRIGQMSVAPSYFVLLGVKPQKGVVFDPADRTPGFNEQAVISDGLWKRAFGGDPNVVGRIVQVDSDSYRVVGVMPPGFQAPARGREVRQTDIWSSFGFAGAPLSRATVESRAPLFPGAVARLRSGITVADAQRKIDALVETLRRQYPADYPPRVDWRVRLVPLQQSVAGDVHDPLLFLFGAVALVLLIGCANVANLSLARATTRGREMAVRQAIGGSPSRLRRQLLTESIVLGLLGGAVGVALLIVSKRLLIGMLPAGIPRMNDISIDWSVLGVALAASVGAGVIAGLGPALDVGRQDVTKFLKQEGRSSTSSRRQKRTRRLLVVGEFALSLVLMTAAGLLLRSFWTLLNAPLGFEPSQVSVIRTRLPYPNDPKEDLYPNAAAEAPFVRALLERLRELPGAQQVALGSGAAVPLDHPQQDQSLRRILFESSAVPSDQPMLVTTSAVTSDYFHVLGMTLLRGRQFEIFDDENSPSVAIVNESMAQAYWPNDDAIGKRLKLSPRATSWTTVVGVVADARTESPTTARVPHLYASLYQLQGKHLAIFVKGRIETAALANAVREQVQSLNSALPVFGEETLSATVAASLAERRLSMELIASFALTALLLAALGIYGVTSYMVNERTQEIGLRIALGAQRRDVMRMVMRQGVRLAIAGAVLGMGGALLVSRAMAGLLIGVNGTDPLILSAAVLLLTAVAIAGCWIPARRAVRIDPISALG